MGLSRLVEHIHENYQYQYKHEHEHICLNNHNLQNPRMVRVQRPHYDNSRHRRPIRLRHRPPNHSPNNSQRLS